MMRVSPSSPWITWALLGLVPWAGCGRSGRPAAAPAAKARPQSYKLVGVVREVDPKAGVVTIRHEAIPGFMGAMTMPFEVRAAKDKGFLDEVRPGDKVEGRLHVRDDSSDLTDLEITDYAEPPPMVLGKDGRLAPKPAVLEPGQAVPDFTVTTQDGAALRLSDLRGKVVVLTFIYTRCPLPNFCPLMDRKFAELAGQIGAVPARAERVRLLSVSFDAEHDTPAVLTQHAKRMGAHPPLWTYAAATPEALGEVGPALGLMYGPVKGEVIHNLVTAVIGPDGTLQRLERGGDWAPPELLKAVGGLLRGGR